jgi:Bacterial lectin
MVVKRLALCILVTVSLFVTSPAQAGVFDAWSLNGSASTVDAGNVLRLTGPFNSQAGSAWAPEKVSLSNDFSIAFSFKIHGGSGADGYTLTFHNNANGNSALGNGGGFLGYQGIDKSVAFVYDTFENGFNTDLASGHNTAIARGGDLVDPFGGLDVSRSVNVNGGNLRDTVLYSWVDYNSAGSQLDMYLADSPIKPADSMHNVSFLPGEFGSSNLFVGFTAGTGGLTDNHDILSFSITPVPLPGALLLFGAGLTGLAAFGHLRGRIKA